MVHFDPLSLKIDFPSSKHFWCTNDNELGHFSSSASRRISLCSRLSPLALTPSTRKPSRYILRRCVLPSSHTPFRNLWEPTYTMAGCLRSSIALHVPRLGVGFSSEAPRLCANGKDPCSPHCGAPLGPCVIS